MKYLLVSQFHHDHKMFFIECDKETFIKKARNVLKELETYKSASCGQDDYYGDLDEEWYKEEDFGRRYIINYFNGDFYFIPILSESNLRYEINYYTKFPDGYIKNIVKSDIKRQHQQVYMDSIVYKYFERASLDFERKGEQDVSN